MCWNVFHAADTDKVEMHLQRLVDWHLEKLSYKKPPGYIRSLHVNNAQPDNCEKSLHVRGGVWHNLTHNLALSDPLCCLKGLWNVEQIPLALSAWARSPLAGLKSQRPARELTEFHMKARNRGTSCLSLTACPTLALICLLACLSGCVCACFKILFSF